MKVFSFTLALSFLPSISSKISSSKTKISSTIKTKPKKSYGSDDYENYNDNDDAKENFYRMMQTKFESMLESQIETNGLWLGISDPDYGDMYWVFGDAVVGEAATPATVDDHFYIGSISKSFGATVHLLLIEEGYYDYHDTMQDLLPEHAQEFPEYANYTVKDLLSMQTCVPDFLNHPEGLMKEILRNTTQRFTIQDIINFALRDGAECYPNFHGQYSTTNYLVMENVAETITQKPMQELVEEMVLKPLNLLHTSEPERDGDGILPSPAANPYAGPSCVLEIVMIGGNATEGDDLSNLSQTIVITGTGGSMWSTIGDLLQWAKSGTGDSLLSPETVQVRHQYTEILEEIEYGIGQYIEDQWYGHAGDAFGFGTSAFKNDVLGASFAAAANSCFLSNVLDEFRTAYEKELLNREYHLVEHVSISSRVTRNNFLTFVCLILMGHIHLTM